MMPEPQQPTEPMAALAAVGHALRDSIEEVMDAFVARLPHDPAIPMASNVDMAELEDHASSYLVDVATGLLAMSRSTTDISDLLKDGSQVQQLVSTLHGAQRARLGWSEDALLREFEVLQEEVEKNVRRRARDIPRLEIGLDLIRQALERDREVSLRALRTHGRD